MLLNLPRLVMAKHSRSGCRAHDRARLVTGYRAAVDHAGEHGDDGDLDDEVDPELAALVRLTPVMHC
jgi:hypothetical protein